MGKTQLYMTGLIVYFTFLFIVIALFSNAGLFGDSGIVASGNSNFQTEKWSYNETSVPSGATAVFSWGDYLKDVFSFFVWDIHYYDTDKPTLMQYFWIIRIFLVYLPLFFLILSIYYSLPTVSG